MEWNNKLASMHGLEIAFPFLDRDMISFLIGIPGEVQTWKGIPKTILREAMRGVLPETVAARRWKADYTRLANQGMSLDYTHVLQCFQSDGLGVRSGYLRGDVLREELDRLRGQIQGSTCEITWSLAELLGLELWLRAFFGERSGEKGGSETWDHKTVISASMR
jgi:asparagine synthase (glutamine-hydrolysing)